MMNDSAFIKLEFLLLVLFSLILPLIFVSVLITRRTMPRKIVVAFGFALVVLAGSDVVLLQMLKEVAKASASLSDDFVFASGYSLALYILPLIGAGLGMNLISHVIHAHIKIIVGRDDEAAGK